MNESKCNSHHQLTASEASKDEMDRQRFEKWAAIQPQAKRYGYAERDGQGGYFCSWHDNAWNIWQAALKSKQGEV